MTDLYALFGDPVAHSRSPQIHAAFAAQTGEDIAYEAIAAPAGTLKQAVAAFIERGGRGFNLTVPLKLEGLELADETSPEAELAGATNCVKIEDGRLIARNYDGSGIVRDIEDNLGCAFAGRTVLMLGAGGAARGAIPPIVEAGAAQVVIANRTAARARELARLFSARGAVQGAGFADLGTDAFDIVINATSASLHGDAPPVRAEALRGSALAYDMMYGKGLTPFLALARAQGARRIADGVGMLVEQAADAFEWWRGVRPSTGQVIADITVPLD